MVRPTSVIVPFSYIDDNDLESSKRVVTDSRGVAYFDGCQSYYYRDILEGKEAAVMSECCGGGQGSVQAEISIGAQGPGLTSDAGCVANSENP